MVVSVTELPVLEPEEQRILGSLLEKQALVPASYPLTANALRAACNQTSNRDPVVDFDQQTVERTARALKERGLLRIVWSDTGRRTLKYGSPGMSVGHPGARSWGRWSSIGPQESMTSARAAVGEWKP